VQDATQTAVSETPTAADTWLSRDAMWWWTGRRWVPARTADGLWRWDGAQWQPTIDLGRQHPRDLAVSLTLLAEDRYARAGEILIRRSSEWRAGPQEQILIVEARAAKGPFAGIAGGLTGWLGGARAADGMRSTRLQGDRRSALIRLGRGAPRPTVKEADDLLNIARFLDHRAGLLSAAIAEADEAEMRRSAAILAAQQSLAEAEETRRNAVELAKQRAAEADAASSSAVAEAKGRLVGTRSSGQGDLRSELGELRLFDAVLDTPRGRLTAAGARAVLGTAAELWRDEETLLGHLSALESPDAVASVEALAEGGEQHFLLLVGVTSAVLVACPEGDVETARRFASAVNKWAPKAERARVERESRAHEIEAELKALRDEHGSAAAREELSRVEADRSLLEAIEQARLAVEQARIDTPELSTAWTKVSELACQFTTPPEPLQSEQQ
jgi:hypothetical protein